MKPALLLVAATLVTTACSAEPFVCPGYLELTSTPLIAAELPPASRALVAPGRVWLSGASLFDGPPEEQASLVPDNAESDGPAQWTLASSAAGGYWLSCDYADGLVRVTQPVAATVSRCSATVAPANNPAASVTVQFDCQ